MLLLLFCLGLIMSDRYFTTQTWHFGIIRLQHSLFYWKGEYCSTISSKMMFLFKCIIHQSDKLHKAPDKNWSLYCMGKYLFCPMYTWLKPYRSWAVERIIIFAWTSFVNNSSHVVTAFTCYNTLVWRTVSDIKAFLNVIFCLNLCPNNNLSPPPLYHLK